jgi:hypothetical protein
MDPQPVSFELRELYLLVVGHGKRDSFTSMVDASEKIFIKVRETQARRLLVDYRKLEINVRMSDAFNIVKRYEAAQPELRNLKIAAVFDGPGMEFGKYWKEVCRQRGFLIETFENMEEAEKWLVSADD